ncbi:MAG: zinc ribbon domain-containing protein [Vicinamibacterales bacterium]
MSSATSIDRVNAKGVSDAQAPARSSAHSRDAFRPWHFFVLASLLAATAAVVMARQARPEHLVVISLTIGAAGFAAAALFRTLVPLVTNTPPSGNEPITESMRAVLEREKFLVLRSIKELEFDRAMGKVSPKDFDEMAGRLRARAMSLMRQLDSGAGYRELIERELSARLRKPPSASRATADGAAPRHERRTAATSEPAFERRSAGASARQAAEQPKTSNQERACACGTLNDSDAAFCKRCGTKLEPSSRS